MNNNSNANSNVINRTGDLSTVATKGGLNSTLAATVFNSIATSNPIAASGGSDGDTIQEIRQNILANYGSQQRNVTADD